MIFSNFHSLGLLRIQIFKKNGTEHESPEWCDIWLLEDGEKWFYVLVRHHTKGGREIEIDRFSKENYNWTIRVDS